VDGVPRLDMDPMIGEAVRAAPDLKSHRAGWPPPMLDEPECVVAIDAFLQSCG
jgi:hypothetical protein